MTSFYYFTCLPRREHINLNDNSFFLDRAAAKKKLTDLAEKYGLYVNPDAVISDLSVGEQQRVEILKALYRNVELLILDEPTGVLTPQETTQFSMFSAI